MQLYAALCNSVNETGLRSGPIERGTGSGVRARPIDRAHTRDVNHARAGLARLQAAAVRGDLDALCARHGVRVLTVFGSTGRGEAAPRDLDVAILLEPGATPDLLALIAELTAVADTDIDPALLHAAGPVLRERALVGSVGLYESERGALANAAIAAIGERVDTDWARRLSLELMAR